MKNFTKGILAAALCIGLLSGCGASIEKTMAKGEELYNNGDYAGAVEQYEKVLEKDPNNEPAKKMLTEARLRQDPANAEAWVSFLETEENDQTVLETLKEYVESRPSDNEELNKLLEKYAPATPYLYYNTSYDEGYQKEMICSKEYEQSMEAAFFCESEDGEDARLKPDVINYTINGEEFSVRYSYPDGEDLFKTSECVYFGQPGEYEVVASSYNEEYGLRSAPSTVVFTIPEDAVSKIKVSVPGGEYETLEAISMSVDNELHTIYYTLDGTDPIMGETYGKYTIQGSEYHNGYIVLPQGKTTLSARCISDSGVIGELVQETYDVKTIPAMVTNRIGRLATDGRFVYIATDKGVRQLKNDGTGEQKITLTPTTRITVMPNGKVAFFGSGGGVYNLGYYYDETLEWSKEEVFAYDDLFAYGNALYVGDDYVKYYSSDPKTVFTQAQKNSFFFNQKYCFLKDEDDYQTFFVCKADGSDYKMAVDVNIFPERADELEPLAIKGNTVVFVCKRMSEGVSFDTIHHYYTLNLDTGAIAACTKLNEKLDAARAEGKTYELIGFGNNAAYFWTDDSMINWTRIAQEW